MRRLRLLAATLVMLASLILLAWGLRPAQSQKHSLRIDPAAIMPNARGISGQAPPAIANARLLTLEYPSTIRAGDSAVIRLTLGPDSSSTLSSLSGAAASQGQGSVGSAQPPAPESGSGVIAEADLELEGANFSPGGPVSEPLLPGESAAFRWSVQPLAPGTYRGAAWSFLVFTDTGGATQSRQAIAAQPVEIRSSTLFGLGGGAARLGGLVGVAVGAVLGIPMAEKLIRWASEHNRGVA